MNEPQLTLGAALFFLSMIGLVLASVALQIYGTYLCFVKKWYMGVVALIVPAFAMVVGVFKLFKKDILK